MKIKLPQPYRWYASATLSRARRLRCPPAAPLGYAPHRVSFTTPADPRWATYHSVASTARPSAVAFR